MLAPAAIVVGVLLLLSASSSSQVRFIVILGLLSLASGLLFLFGPRQKIEKASNWWFSTTNKTHKAWGAVLIGLGIAILATIVH